MRELGDVTVDCAASRALHGLVFRVEGAADYGLLRPNRACKATMLHLAVGFVRSTRCARRSGTAACSAVTRAGTRSLGVRPSPSLAPAPPEPRHDQ